MEDPMNIDQVVKWLDTSMEEACDVAAPWIGSRRPRRKAYWWCEFVADLRRRCIRARRSWQRAKKRRRSEETIADLGVHYKHLRKDLRLEIGRRKSAAWQELLGSVDKDPWGLPYRLVLKKLKTASLGLTEVLEPEMLTDLLESLFPPNDEPDPVDDWSNFVWDNAWATSPTEVNEAIKKATSSWTKAPGPDGLRMAVWRRSTREFLHWVSHLFNLCLSKGEFPLEWKGANLVLIPKENTPSAGLPKVRPICLLNDIGKTFERVLEIRISRWQEGSPESDVSEFQFGFRRHWSTCDALRLLREIISSAVNDGGFAVVVSLDIQIAFNSLPWRIIRQALKEKLFPSYIRQIIDSYLADRTVWYIGRDGRSHSWPMEAGVPQGSVLGPVLWNLGFDCILDIAEDDENSNILCYADDTLVVVTGRNCELTCLKASILVNRVIDRIRGLGLSVATNKTEAILFTVKGWRSPELDFHRGHTGGIPTKHKVPRGHDRCALDIFGPLPICDWKNGACR
ncbi:reverse transcriptase [Lasius niger]|uniref:Reverse transcriptase n=1 Tax=Lasius niger TaxID=67767 RepID=A0A0J7KQR4_LASNI|nr:reverse transcriptase [Lasius niger]